MNPRGPSRPRPYRSRKETGSKAGSLTQGRSPRIEDSRGENDRGLMWFDGGVPTPFNRFWPAQDCEEKNTYQTSRKSAARPLRHLRPANDSYVGGWLDSLRFTPPLYWACPTPFFRCRRRLGSTHWGRSEVPLDRNRWKIWGWLRASWGRSRWDASGRRILDAYRVLESTDVVVGL
jgi:hypothetical protein